MYKLWNELEMNRRIIHFSGVIIPIAYLMGIVSWKFIGVILFILSLIVLKLEYVRLYHGFDNIIYDNLTRTYEADSIAGYALYVIGIFLAWLFYPPIAAISGMLMLSVGDPISGIIGSIEETDETQWWIVIIIFVTCSFIVLPVTILELGISYGIISAIIGSVGAVIVDEFKPRINGQIIDDNLTIPLVSGLLITIFTVLF